MPKADLKTKQLLFKPTIKECPHCGCEEYYYKQHVVANVIHFRRFDGAEIDNGDIRENLIYKPQGKFAYCCNCDKKVFRFKK